MYDVHFQSVEQGACSNLHNATGVCGGDCLGAAFGDGCNLVAEDVSAQLGMLEIVDTRSATATLEAPQRNKRYSWNGSQNFRRRLGDSLSVYQVTRRIVSDSPFDAARRSHNAHLDEEL